MENIQRRCQCPAECKDHTFCVPQSNTFTISPTDGVALVDEKKSILHLSDERPTSCCCSLFTNRATYVLVAVDSKHIKKKIDLCTKHQYSCIMKGREDLTPKYIPLLDNIEPDLALKLDVLSNPRGSDQQRMIRRNNRGSKTNILLQATTTAATYGKRKQSVCPSMMAARKSKQKS